MTHYAGVRLCACVPHVCVCGRRAKRQIIFLELFCAYLAGRGESSAPRFYGRIYTQFSALPIFCAVDFFDGLRRLDFEQLRRDSRNGAQCSV